VRVQRVGAGRADTLGAIVTASLPYHVQPNEADTLFWLVYGMIRITGNS
jgi:hypothetical protein